MLLGSAECGHSGIEELIVATKDDEVKQIESLHKLASANGVPGLEIIDSRKIKELEPSIDAKRALFSSETGIIYLFKFQINLGKLLSVLPCLVLIQLIPINLAATEP